MKLYQLEITYAKCNTLINLTAVVFCLKICQNHLLVVGKIILELANLILNFSIKRYCELIFPDKGFGDAEFSCALQ